MWQIVPVIFLLYISRHLEIEDVNLVNEIEIHHPSLFVLIIFTPNYIGMLYIENARPWSELQSNANQLDIGMK